MSSDAPQPHPGDQSAENTKLLVLSGPSGSGKTTIVRKLLQDTPVPLRICVSATTRPPRTGEIDGDDYHFLNADEFEQKRKEGEFLETAEVFSSGYWYGTLKSEIQRAADQSAWAFLEIDVEGALNVMREYPEAVTIFIRASSDDEYEVRLRGRGTESEEVIQKRLATARRELAQADRYKYQVINDELDRAVEEIKHILRTEEAD